MGENDLNFRTEEKAVRGQTIIQWLDSQPIAGDEQALLACVPNSEGEHAPHMVGAISSVSGDDSEQNLITLCGFCHDIVHHS